MKTHSAALAAGSAASFLVPFMMSAVAIAMPVIQTEFSATAVELSWIVGSYILTLAAILLPVGRLSDIIGHKRTFVWGTGAFMCSSLCASLAWSAPALIVLRISQGIGASMILSTGVAIVTESYPLQERGRAMGILVACVYLGLSVGPLVGGFMTDLAGWRSIFFLCLFPGILGWVLARRIRGEWCPAREERFDLPGGLFYALFVICCVGGLTGLSRPERGWPLLAGAALAGTLFFLRSRRASQPIVELALFRNRTFTLSSLATMINYSGTAALGFLLSLYLQVVKGFSGRTPSQLFACTSARCPASGRILAGRTSPCCSCACSTFRTGSPERRPTNGARSPRSASSAACGRKTTVAEAITTCSTRSRACA